MSPESAPRSPDLVLDPLDVAPSEPLHLAPQLEIPAGSSSSSRMPKQSMTATGWPAELDDPLRVEVEVLLVTHGEDEGIDALERLIQVFLRPSGP